MPPNKKLLALVVSLLLLTLLLAACAAPPPLQPSPPVVVPPPAVPQLPREARQPTVPPICSPTCLSSWKLLVERLQTKLTGAEPPASPASEPPTR